MAALGRMVLTMITKNKEAKPIEVGLDRVTYGVLGEISKKHTTITAEDCQAAVAMAYRILNRKPDQEVLTSSDPQVRRVLIWLGRGDQDKIRSLTDRLKQKVDAVVSPALVDAGQVFKGQDTEPLSPPRRTGPVTIEPAKRGRPRKDEVDRGEAAERQITQNLDKSWKDGMVDLARSAKARLEVIRGGRISYVDLNRLFGMRFDAVERYVFNPGHLPKSPTNQGYTGVFSVDEALRAYIAYRLEVDGASLKRYSKDFNITAELYSILDTVKSLDDPERKV